MTMTQVRLFVSNFERCHRFYQDIMGLHPLWGDASTDTAGFRLGEGPTLSLHRADAAISPGSQDRVALVFTFDDIDASVRNLEALGVEFLGPPQAQPDWGVRAVHLRDPEGNLIEINSPLPRSEWTGEFRDAAERREQRR